MQSDESDGEASASNRMDGRASELLHGLGQSSMFHKEFKVLGQVGTTKGCLSFLSLRRQIEGGVSKGYTEEEIIEAVIRAVSQGTGLRSYLEYRDDLTLSTLKEIIRSHYKERDASDYYTELCNLTQGPKEDAHDYVIRALGLRERILTESRDTTLDSHRYSSDLVKAKFFESLYTGFIDDNIRNEMRPVLNNDSISDETLIRSVNQISRRESERFAKLKSNKGKAQISKVDTPVQNTDTDPVKRGEENNNSANEIKELKKEIAELKDLFMTMNNKQFDSSEKTKKEH